MTARTKYAPRMTAISAAALLLAGCSSGHVGEDWQCPLAAGGSCASVAAADPAVPKTDAAPAREPGQPLRLLPREWNAERTDRTAASPSREPAPNPIRGPGQAPAATLSCEAYCGIDPFGWLAWLFGVPEGETVPPPDVPAVEADSTDKSGKTLAAPAQMTKPEPAALPAVSDDVDDDTNGDDLRTGETVARIWIAPFVDADGIYREAAHVRVVLEPAGWRLK